MNLIHKKALFCVANYKVSEKELLQVLESIDSRKAYLEMGFSSLFNYCVKFLHLSESESCRFIAVSRTAKKVPELKKVLSQGELTVSKCSMITSILNNGNATEWIHKARELPQRELQIEVAKINPKSITKDRIKVLTPSSIELKTTLTPQLHQKIKRVQDLIGSSSLEETLEVLTSFYLKRKDPLMKITTKVTASMVENPKNLPTLSPTLSDAKPQSTTLKITPAKITNRKPIPPSIKAIVYQRLHGQCAFESNLGNTCTETRFLHMHHKKPISQGGGNEPENLTLFCSNHHRYFHKKEHRRFNKL